MTPPTPLLQALRALWPPPLTIDARERVRVAVGVALGLFVAGALTYGLGGDAGPWLVAPLGASAVLVFGVPASPLAQPWPVVGGNTLSALVGIACVQLLPQPLLAAPLAAGLAVALMLALRCLHPPGGASALLTVLGGVHDWRFALAPVLLNSLLLASAGMLYNSATGRRYPHVSPPPTDVVDVGERFTDADLDAALQRYNQLVDLPRDDLRGLLGQAEAQAQQRRLSRRRCSDIMSGEPATVGADTPLHEAWTLLHERRVKALPVVDDGRRLLGIVTLADFMRAAGLQAPGSGDDALLHRLRTAPGGGPPEPVGSIMTRRVRVASAGRSLAELLPLLTSTGHHHIPVIDDDRRLLGMVTQSDVIAELLRER